MAKYKVLKPFIDKETKQTYKQDKEIELTVKRAEEVENKLGADYLERVEEKKSKK